MVFFNFSAKSKYMFSYISPDAFLSLGRIKTLTSIASAPASSILLANPIHSFADTQLILAITGILTSSLAFLIKLRYS